VINKDDGVKFTIEIPLNRRIKQRRLNQMSTAHEHRDYERSRRKIDKKL